jgi:hypothetical protein
MHLATNRLLTETASGQLTEDISKVLLFKYNHLHELRQSGSLCMSLQRKGRRGGGAHRLLLTHVYGGQELPDKAHPTHDVRFFLPQGK